MQTDVGGALSQLDVCLVANLQDKMHVCRLKGDVGSNANVGCCSPSEALELCFSGCLCQNNHSVEPHGDTLPLAKETGRFKGLPEEERLLMVLTLLCVLHLCLLDDY